MLRLATPGHSRFTQARSYEASFGGGEANVAVSLANFGEAVAFVTRLPENDLGMRVYGISKPTGSIHIISCVAVHVWGFISLKMVQRNDPAR